MTIKGETEVASLCAVHYDKEADDVLVTFRVQDEEYKSMVLQVARRKDIELVVRGERLLVAPAEEEDNASL